MLNFKNASSLEAFGVERLEVGSPGVGTYNHGYRAPLPSRVREKEVENRRNNILNGIIARDLCRPEHNVLRNEGEPMEDDEKTVYEEDVAD